MAPINPIIDGYYKVSLGTPVGKVEGNVLLYTDYRLDEELKIGIEYGEVQIEQYEDYMEITIILQFGKADPLIGDVQYNVKFKITIGGKVYEEYGFVTEDGLKVKIMGFLGFKTMEWINEDEASEIGIK